jgi:hypothetical protein
VVGVADHAGWAVLLTVGNDGVVHDRRRVELVEPGVPVMPYHHEAQGLPPQQALALVERVRQSAERCSRACLELLAREASAEIVGIALRECPPLPETVEQRLGNYRAQNVADWVMYRQVLAEAARERGWTVSWYDSKRVFADAACALRIDSIDELLRTTGAQLGPPWQKDHKLALAAALAARP